VVDVKLGIRPEYVRLVPPSTSGSLPAEVLRWQDLGTSVLVTAQCAGQVLRARLPLGEAVVRPGDAVHVQVLNAHSCFYKDEEWVA
jgi:glycerol transport system ATP-binding protein